MHKKTNKNQASKIFKSRGLRLFWTLEQVLYISIYKCDDEEFEGKTPINASKETWHSAHKFIHNGRQRLFQVAFELLKEPDFISLNLKYVLQIYILVEFRK